MFNGILFILLWSLAYSDNIPKRYIRMNNQIEIDLHKILEEKYYDNLVYSGYGIETMIEVFSFGANGETSEELRKVLQYPKSDDVVEEQLKDVLKAIRGISENVSISSEVTIYVDDHIKLEYNFTENVRDLVAGKIQKVNFQHLFATNSGKDVKHEITQEMKKLYLFKKINATSKFVINELNFTDDFKHPLEPSKKKPKRFYSTKSTYADTTDVEANLYVAKNKEAETTFTGISSAGTDDKVRSFISPADEPQVIKELYKSKKIKATSKFVIINEFTFTGDFQYPFNPTKTKPKKFYLTKSKSTFVDTMEVTANLYVVKNKKAKTTFIGIPFDGTDDKVRFLISLTDEIDALQELQKFLKKNPIFYKDAKKKYVHLYLPKFNLTSYKKPLECALRQMGINLIFTNPNLTAITKEEIYADGIFQEAKIFVTETGVKSFSYTSANSNSSDESTDTREKPEILHVDRPFFFSIIYEGIILISGKVMNPLEGIERTLHEINPRDG